MIERILTGDGSHSLRHTELQETYHSVHGAIRESQWVYIQEGLQYWKNKSITREIHVLEVGFGTGLNALLTLLVPDQEKTIVYETWEKYPIDEAMVQSLNYGERLDAAGTFLQLHSSPWDTDVVIQPGFTLRKQRGDIHNAKFSSRGYDIVFYDAFAPSRQPDMWTKELLATICSAMRPGAVLVTYCAKGQLKRDLRDLGLQVETLPGPPGKKEIVRAQKNQI